MTENSGGNAITKFGYQFRTAGVIGGGSGGGTGGLVGCTGGSRGGAEGSQGLTPGGAHGVGCASCGMCIIPGQVNPYFPAICGRLLCVPYASLHFRRFRSMRLSAGDPDIDCGNSGNRQTTFGHHSYPSRTSHVISWSVLVRIVLFLSTVYLFRHYSTCFRFGTELLRIVIFFFHFP